ncbi:hypothetical protein BDZ89DRAFT_1072539 [Hymenopellis radicata]|nr:hypothetical protein BDZ89DRAFT_1072539 [Hymenopellis radicata]
MPVRDICTADCSQTLDGADDASDEEDIDILRLIECGDPPWEWVLIKSRDPLGTSLDNLQLKGWISPTEYIQWLDVLVDAQERCLEALNALAETVCGVEREQYRRIRSNSDSMDNYCDALQAVLIVIKCSTRAWTNADWWAVHNSYIPRQRMYHISVTSSVFDERILLDLSPGRPWKDLADVLQITLPYFREMTARVQVLSKLHRVGGSSDSTSTFGPTTIANLITCLDVAESVAKLVPVLGHVLEGTCGILRKIVQAAEGARAARDECKALAEHTACITLAIINEIGSRATGCGANLKKIWDLSAVISQVNQRIQKLSKLGDLKYFASRGKIKAQVQELRAQVDNARISFQIGYDISTTRLLYDLSMMQARLMSRVDDIYKVQTRMNGKLDMTNRKLDMILVTMHGAGYGDGQAYVEAENED